MVIEKLCRANPCNIDKLLNAFEEDAQKSTAWVKPDLIITKTSNGEVTSTIGSHRKLTPMDKEFEKCKDSCQCRDCQDACDASFHAMKDSYVEDVDNIDKLEEFHKKEE